MSETQAIHLEYDLPHAPTKVWRALTDKQIVSKWLMDTDLEPVVGRAFTFRQPATQWWDGIVRGEVLAVDAPRLLKYTWKGGPKNAPLDTVVTWTLAPTTSGGTLLSLDHTGFLPGNPFAYEGAKSGWQRLVGERLMQQLGEEAECSA